MTNYKASPDEVIQCHILNDEAIRISGLSEALCALSIETILSGNLRHAQNLSWSYECLADLAMTLAAKLEEIAPL